ncbi:MAG: GNAT family N-acetyltransferase [Gammaproteobacteria bacterium]|nr:GNAT family N-acetyltransferase [Gammaproteobacteria bacterium]MCF6261629.1 GNAT family N-acetyltransferase [Gammaproteobacteria bacterium]
MRRESLGCEAIVLLVQWVRYTLALSHLVYSVDKNNIPSRKIAESLGGVVVSDGRQEPLSGK